MQGQPRSGARSTPDHFDVARDYSILHAASACINVWLLNRSTADPLHAESGFACSLHRLLERLHSPVEPQPSASAVINTLEFQVTSAYSQDRRLPNALGTNII